MTRPRRNFDLPTKYINDVDGSNYAPPRARDPEEIARRKALRPGSLIREFQASGAKVAEAVFNYPATEPDDINYIRRKLAVPLLNSAWYTFADSAKTPDIFMRRVIKMPVLAIDKPEESSEPGVRLDSEVGAEIDIEDETITESTPNDDPESEAADSNELKNAGAWRASEDFLIGQVRHGLAQAVRWSGTLDIEYKQGLETKRMRTEKRLGRIMGNTALGLISLQHADAPLGMSEAEIQDIVMLDALELLEEARTSHVNTGYHASIAQLADSDSPLAIDWRKNAPQSGQAYLAFVQAQLDFGKTL